MEEKRKSAYMETRRHVTGFEAWRSEEFQAFCKRFGIVWGLPSKKLTLVFTEEELLATQEYQCNEHDGERSPFIDTTTVFNETFRTKVPRPDHEVSRKES